MVKILFVGPIPPPLGGFSYITSCMLGILKSRHLVASYNTSVAGKFQLPLYQLFLYFRELLFHRPCVVYVALSGGFRQYFDLFFIFFARLFRCNLVFHHHSFSYLHKSFLSFNLINYIAGLNSIHIVLGDIMKDNLIRVAGLPKKNIIVISNSAFLQESSLLICPFSKIHDCIRIGFLSNITRAKGIFTFINLVKYFHSKGVVVSATIAGPVDPTIRDVFFHHLTDVPSISYLGAVYGDDKEIFFESIDFFVFPTMYANEAEPVVLLEALAKGKPVVTIGQGGIADVINADCGLLLNSLDLFEELAFEWIIKEVNMPEIYLLRQRCIDRFNYLRGINNYNLNLFVDSLG